jgi:N-acetylglutamate synthase-like GNAT family acetyltransferase
MIKIQEYSPEFHLAVVDLVTSIQQKEFGVPITYEDQPDLMDISGFFQKNNGNFWIALDGEKVVGSMALIGLGSYGVMRKVFVHKDYRGQEFGIAKSMLMKLEQWCRLKNMSHIYLGTVDTLKAAHRFYEKNDYIEIKADQLPKDFPRMEVDTKFYFKEF